MVIGVDCPRRVIAGGDLRVRVTLETRAPVEVVDASVRWITSLPYHSKFWTFIPARASPGWSEIVRKEQDTVVSSSRLRDLVGTWDPAKASPDVTVRVETVGVAASCVSLSGFGAVLSRVEASVRLTDGSEVTERQKVWVRPRPPEDLPPPSPSTSPSPLSTPAPIEILGLDHRRALYSELYRPLQGIVRLTAGGTGGGGADAGSLRFRLICSAVRHVHYLVPVRGSTPPGAVPKALDHLRRDWQEKSMEEDVSEQVTELGRLPVPALAAGATVEVPYSFAGPKGTAQTTECAEGRVRWVLEVTWHAGGVERKTAVPIVMAIAPPGDRGRWWRLRGH